MTNSFLKAQSEMGAITKDSKNPFFNSMYFDINGILRAVKPVLNGNGLVVTQPIQYRDGKNILQTVIAKEDGTIVAHSEMALPEVADVQKFGGAITYFRRYALQSLLALEAEDDDGNSASGKVAPRPAARKVKPVSTYSQDTPFGTALSYISTCRTVEALAGAEQRVIASKDFSNDEKDTLFAAIDERKAALKSLN